MIYETMSEIRMRKFPVSPPQDISKLSGAIESLDHLLELHEKKRLLYLELRRTLLSQMVGPRK